MTADFSSEKYEVQKKLVQHFLEAKRKEHVANTSTQINDKENLFYKEKKKPWNIKQKKRNYDKQK